MEAIHLLRQNPLFDCVSDRTLASFADVCESRLVEEGRVVARAKEPVHRILFIAEGEVALYRKIRETDSTLLLGAVKGPAIIGDMELSAELPWVVSVRALCDTWLVLMPPQAFNKLVRGHAELAFRMYIDANRRHLIANIAAQVGSLHDVTIRLLRLLLAHADLEAGVTPSTITTQPLAQTELADALGLNRRTVARTLKPLEDDGIVSRSDDGQRFVLHLDRGLKDLLPADLMGLRTQVDDRPMPLRELLETIEASS